MAITYWPLPVIMTGGTDSFIITIRSTIYDLKNINRCNIVIVSNKYVLILQKSRNLKCYALNESPSSPGGE